ncbi:MAG: HlyD family efflux transporter periplasmic adaptor subunit [Lachnospiraceae bacterium]|nr:HlyD family efflux transporter periplasmic adaptor subunit [Lachnospiraceae bacterium]
MKRVHFILTAAIAVGIISIGTALVAQTFSIKKNREDDMAYYDAAAEYGTLTVGITKTASVTPTAVEQTFDLDIGTWTDEDSAAPQIEEVLVSAGQQVRKGTALFRVTSDSVQNIRTLLQRELFDADRDCRLLEAKQRELHLLASQESDSEAINAKYADVMYSNKCAALQKRADDAKGAVDEKQNQVNETLLELTQTQEELAAAQKYLKEAEAAVSENYDNRYSNAYYYTMYEKTRETAENMVKQLEEQIERLTKQNESLLFEVDEAVRAYHQAVQDLEKEKLAVKMDYDTEIYDLATASEYYDILMVSLDNDLQEARERYQTALHNIRIFNAYIVRNQVFSEYNGILSDIVAKAGDTVGKNDTLVILYDQEAATMEVLLCEEDFLALNQEEKAKISFSNDTDVFYEGRIMNVSKKEKNTSSKDSYYIVTVMIQGDVTSLSEGTEGDITFLTNETKEVLYVPNSAVFWEDGRSYVKMRNKIGNIVEKNVTTGFSDGVSTEIKKGISEGDVVLCFSGS